MDITVAGRPGNCSILSYDTDGDYLKSEDGSVLLSLHTVTFYMKLHNRVEDFGSCLTSTDIIIAINNMICQFIQKHETEEPFDEL